MARRLRIEFPEAIYHVYNRGDRREEIFCDDTDRERFLETLGEACAKTGWLVHSYCLMGNHFHLVLETPQPNLVAGMKWMLGTYTARFNRRHKMTGHLFAGRYKAQVVGGVGGYLRTVCDYVHLNPVRAKLIRPDEPLTTFRWSSFPVLLQPPPKRSAWLRVDRLFGEHGIPQDSAAGRREFELRLERRRTEDNGEECQTIRKAWCVGNAQFRGELLEQLSQRVGKHHFGEEIREAVEAKAVRIVAEELKRLRWHEEDLATRRKGDPAKLALAQRLRSETTVSLQWIADHLCMGAKTYLAHLLYWQKRNRNSSGPPKPKPLVVCRDLNIPTPAAGNSHIPLTDPEEVDSMRFD